MKNLIKALIFVVALIDTIAVGTIEIALLWFAYTAMGSMFIPAVIGVGVIGTILLVAIFVVVRKIRKRGLRHIIIY